MSTRWRHSSWGDEIDLEYGKAIRGYPDAIAPSCVFGPNDPIGWTDKSLADGTGLILGRKGAFRGVHFSRDPFIVIDTTCFLNPRVEQPDLHWLHSALIHHRDAEEVVEAVA